jgi:hypothetical protein
MNSEEIFDNLRNIDKNIELRLSIINQNSNSSINIENDSIGSLEIEEIQKNNCMNEINNFEKNLSENNVSLNNAMTAKKNEIVKNLEAYINKIEKETNEFINNIEKSNLSEEDKQVEYAKCIEQLEAVISLNEALKKCCKLSEKNILSFLNEKISPDDYNLISNFLCKNEDNLNNNNIYNHLGIKDYPENIINEMKDPTIRNYIIKTNVDSGGYILLKKFKINNYSDCPNTKEILYGKNAQNLRNKFVRDEIECYSINNISKKDFKYIFKDRLKNNKTRAKTKIFCNESNNNKMEMFRSYTETNFLMGKKELVEKENNNDENLVTKIHIKHCDLSDLTDVQLEGFFNLIKIIKLNSCKLNFTFCIENNINKFDNVTELYLEDCGFVNENFNEAIYAIAKNQRLLENLECLSFKNNNITILSFFKYFMAGEIQDVIFHKLELIDFSNNKINNLEIKILNLIPIIKVLDLSNNNLQFSSLFKHFDKKNKSIIEEQQNDLIKQKQKQAEASKKDEMPKNEETPQNEEIPKNEEAPNNDETPKSEEMPKNEEKPKKEETKKEATEGTQNNHLPEQTKRNGFLYLLSSNPVLVRGNNLDKYLKYLSEALEDINYPLKNISLSGLFHNNRYKELLKSINLTKFNRSLIDINLSSCNITDEELSNLLLNNIYVINVKKINLSNNKLTDNLFKILEDKKYYSVYNNLKSIDLSNNDINLNNTKDFKLFIKLYDIKKVIIKNTNAEDKINSYIRKIIIIFNETQNGEKKTQLNSDELSVKDLIDNNNRQDNICNSNNIKIIIKNTIDHKFIEAAKKIYPDIFEKIDIQHKYL